MYINLPSAPGRCPGCGRCMHCGHSSQPWYQPQFQPIWGGIQGGALPLTQGGDTVVPVTFGQMTSCTTGPLNIGTAVSPTNK